jgi:hypothetical protein
MLTKRAKGNGKMKKLDGALQTMKSWVLQDLEQPWWPRSAKSLGLYKVDEYPNFYHVVLMYMS